MKCKACDTLLNDTEALKKDSRGNFLDLCSECLRASNAALEEDTEEEYGEYLPLGAEVVDY